MTAKLASRCCAGPEAAPTSHKRKPPAQSEAPKPWHCAPDHRYYPAVTVMRALERYQLSMADTAANGMDCTGIAGGYRMRISLLGLLFIMVGLSGCISSSDPSPPASTTIVVPLGSTAVCPNGSQPPC